MRLSRMLVLAGAAILVIHDAAFAAASGDHHAREWAAGCLGCHQPAGGTIPLLHGQSREALAAKFRAYRDGLQFGTVMPQLAKGYTDAQIDAIAEWFAAAKTR
jgi:cytochrome subunit of sulfide dehydrogenase